MDKVRVVLSTIFALCVMAGFAAPASADESPCPAKLDYFLMIYIDNGFGNWPYQKWAEDSELSRTEGSGVTAHCYYIGKLFSAHPYEELEDPSHHWHASYTAIALQL